MKAGWEESFNPSILRGSLRRVEARDTSSADSNAFAQAAPCLKKHHMRFVLDPAGDRVPVDGGIFLDKIKISLVAQGLALGLGHGNFATETTLDFLQAQRQQGLKAPGNLPGIHRLLGETLDRANQFFVDHFNVQGTSPPRPRIEKNSPDNLAGIPVKERLVIIIRP